MQNNVEIIQINISGEDKPGMTSSLTEILARYDAFILDIGQANIHQSLTLGILIKTTADKSGSIMKELLFKASELGVMIRFTPISEERYNDWVGRQGKNRYIITLLGRTVTARHIAEVTKVVAEHGLNIDAIKRLTGRMPLCEDDRAAKSCIELSVRGSLTDQERSTMQEGFMNLSEIGLDVSFQKDDIYRRSRRLICFDMDSTLIETEVIDELAERAGVGDKVREITASAMRGEIDFRESFTERVALLKGLDVSVMEEIARNLPITEGLERMMTILKRVGYKTAILSGGFTYFGNYLRQKYGFDYVYANELEIEQGKLTYEDYSQDVLMLMLHASSLGLPFLPVRLMQGSGLMKFWGISEEKRKTMPKIEDLKCAEIENPMVPGQKVVAVPVPKIDTAIIHVQQASPDGTCIICGDEFHDIDIAIAARKTIVTCEEIVSDEFIRRDPTKTRIFGECVQAVVKAPYGAWPSQCYAYYDDDDAGLKEYDKASKYQDAEDAVKQLEKAAVKAAYEHEGPVYLRFGRLALPVFHDEATFKFEIGKGEQLTEGSDVAIIATGLEVNEALIAAEQLKNEGIQARVINLCTIKPLDEELVVKAAKECGAVVTCEEHSILGGLGEAVAAVLGEQCPVPIRRVGVKDVFGHSGPAWELLEQFGLRSDAIIAAVKELV